MLSASESNRAAHEGREQEIKKKRCDYCKEWFIPVRSWQNFCDDKCRNGFHNDKRAAAREKARETKNKKH